MKAADKKADLAGPGIGNYDELDKVLPQDYRSLLSPKETQQAIFAAKNYIEEHLCEELGLTMVTVPLIVDVESGVNDMLDRDGADAHPVPYSQRLRQAPRSRRDRAGRHEVEAGGPEAVRHAARRGNLHRHAGRAQGLLPRSRPQLLRGPMGVGAGDYAEGAETWNS